MEELTKSEAYQKMLDGFRVRHQYYGEEEYVFINQQGKFETEDGCKHGYPDDEFWSEIQKWETGWVEVEGPFSITDLVTETERGIRIENKQDGNQEIDDFIEQMTRIPPAMDYEPSYKPQQKSWQRNYKFHK